MPKTPINDVDAAIRFYTTYDPEEPTAVASLAELAVWHEHQAMYFDGGVALEGARARTSTHARAAKLRKLVALYESRLKLHRDAVAMLKAVAGD